MNLQLKQLLKNQENLSNEKDKEKIIVKQLKNKSTKEAAFRSLVDLYKTQVYWQARRNVVVHEDADDIAQNVFIKIWQNVDKFRGDAKLSTWIYRITANEIIDFVNSKYKKQEFNSDDLDRVEQSLSEEYFSGTHIEKQFQKALLEIPPRQRMVFTMRYYDETPFKDIAEKLQLTVGAVKASYHHASEKMKRFLLEN
ncbi:MAG: RNA polymerase sigma factor [Bacteroidales bacterium]|jgi:RNA polymerase sigma-70 factor (ECF subfamily)|nr:RNA polymerase sigma factor [Bacteroidales bacterium]